VARLKKVLFPLVLALLSIPSCVLADGGAFIDYEGSVYLPSQKAVIGWDVPSGEETLILSTQIKVEDLISAQELANVAWVVPIPSTTEPEVEEGDVNIFYDLAELFEGRGKSMPWSWVGTVDEGEVTVIAAKEVGIYDVTILRAADASVLVDWLNDNGYVTPESAVPILQRYCEQEDFYFAANRIDLTNKYWDLAVTEDDRVCARAVSESVHPYMEISSGTVDYLMSDLTVCEDATLEVVQTLVELDRGVATPLKITFSPPAPFYPLEVSSINEGETTIDVYVFSDTPVVDRSQSLTGLYMTRSAPEFGESYGLNQEYVTYLSYSGELGLLGADAWFEPCNYDRNADPNYVSLVRKISGVVVAVLFFVQSIAYVAVGCVGFVLLVVGFAKMFSGFAMMLRPVVHLFKRLLKR